VPITVEEESRRGESRYGLTLNANSRVQNRHVLSEGEQRALALACFFAELSGVPGNAGILFDDPVSSLDRGRMRKVAARIVQEAEQGRQVIVFTHDLVFYEEILSCASKEEVKILTHYLCVQRVAGTGVVKVGDKPWLAKKVGERIKYLRSKISNIDPPDDPESDEYRRTVKDYYTDLRETWERLVEEQLLGEVVMRFRCGIMTQNLKYVSVEDADYAKVYWQMKKASEWSGHDMAIAKSLPCPSLDQMKKHLDELEAYYSMVKKRKAQLEKKREALEQPAKAATM
jgi:AAA domain